MAKSVAQLTEQMQRLQRQIDAAKAKEVAGVVARIQQAISHYGLTPEQLFALPKKRRTANGLSGTKGSSTRKSSEPAKTVTKPFKSKTSGVKLPAKFADGVGNSWTGRGSTPRWLAEAIASGKSKDDFAVKARA